MTTTFEDVVTHRDAMLDVFTEITQDCLLLGLAPVHVDVSRYTPHSVHVSVQFAGTDSAAVDQAATSWALAVDNGTSSNYTRSGHLDVDGHRVQITAYTGRPKAPAFPAGYAPRAVEDGLPVVVGAFDPMAAQGDQVMCEEQEPGGQKVCTRLEGHGGQHVACGVGDLALSVWS